MARYSHEELVLFADAETGLKGAIAIHDTTLGPALGGCRMWPHETETAAILDVLRLARAMTYKNAAAGLDAGGGKAIILGDPARDKSTELFRALGQRVERLGGRYVTTEDVGTTEPDMEHIATQTRHIVGRPVAKGGSGDPSPATGFGVYRAIKACAREALGADDLSGRRVVIMGLGKVGTYLASHLKEEGAVLLGADIRPDRVRRAEEQFGLQPVDLAEVFSQECDVFAPCALGGALSHETVPRLRCAVVCGGANNQLLTEQDGEGLRQRGILYGPDYIANAGGVINLSFEMGRAYDPEAAYTRVARIYETMQEVISISKKEGVSTAQAADRLAESRLNRGRQKPGQ